MSNNPDLKPQKVQKVHLDKTLLDELRLKDAAISFDDLDPKLRAKINSWGAPSGSSYDDTELRNRIIKLESDISANTKSDQNSDNKIADLEKKLNKNTADISDLEKRAADTINTFAKPIEMNNLANDVRDKIDRSYNYYQSIIPDGEGIDVTDVAAISEAIKNLQNNSINKSELNNYRRKDTNITIQDLDNSLQNIINSQSAIDVSQKADKTELQNYRDKNTKIIDGDLEATLLNKINYSYSLVSNVDTTVGSMVDKKTENIRSDFENSIVGDRYSFLDATPKDGSGIIYRRQILRASGNEGKSDGYNLYDVLTWIVRYIIGIQYDTGYLSSTQQSAIIKYAKGKSKLNNIVNRDFSTYGNNYKAYYGVEDNNFTLVEAISYILNKMSKTIFNPPASNINPTEDVNGTSISIDSVLDPTKDTPIPKNGPSCTIYKDEEGTADSEKISVYNDNNTIYCRFSLPINSRIVLDPAIGIGTTASLKDVLKINTTLYVRETEGKNKNKWVDASAIATVSKCNYAKEHIMVSNNDSKNNAFLMVIR